MPEKYDFSKIEDRKKFEKLPKEEQDIVIGEAQEEAENLAKRVESGEAEKMVGNKEERKIVLTSEQEKAKQKIIDYLTWGNINHALEIKEEFSLQKEITQQAAEQGFIKYLLYGGNVDTALEIKRRFSLSEEFIVSPEVQRVARERFIKFLSIGDIDFGFKTRDIDSAFEIKDKFSLSEEFIQRAAGEEFIKCLSGNVDTALEIKKRFFYQKNSSSKLQRRRLLMIYLVEVEILTFFLKLKINFLCRENLSPQRKFNGLPNRDLLPVCQLEVLIPHLRSKRDFLYQKNSSSKLLSQDTLIVCLVDILTQPL